MTEPTLLPPQDTPKELSAAATLIPYRRDDLRSRYLGYLACGFSDEESLYALGLTLKWLDLMREDDKFSDLEERIPELRKELSKEYIELDFQRNFRMVLEIDHRVLRKSFGMVTVEDEETGERVIEELTPFEQQYLLKIRSAYTPQQLQLLEAVVSGKDSTEFNFSRWVSENQEVIELSRTDRMVVRNKDG